MQTISLLISTLPVSSPASLSDEIIFMASQPTPPNVPPAEIRV